MLKLSTENKNPNPIHHIKVSQQETVREGMGRLSESGSALTTEKDL